MLQRIKHGIFNTPWNMLRVIQTVLASLVLIQAITEGHYLLIIPALFILYMGLSGSCMACNVPTSSGNQGSSGNISDNVEFTEIKRK